MDNVEEQQQAFPGMPDMQGMEAMLGNLLKNMKMDENMFETCAGFLCQSSLEEEQYEMIMEICQDKLEELTMKKNVEKVTQVIQTFKEQLATSSPSSPLLTFLEHVYNIKAYMNAENEITEKKPTIEYVVEMNYNKENFTFFYTTTIDNVNDKIYGETCIMVQPEEEEKEKEMETDAKDTDTETEKMNTSDESDSDEDMETDDNVTKFEDDTKYEKLMEKMSWCGENVKTELQTVLNQIFTVFEADEKLEW